VRRLGITEVAAEVLPDQKSAVVQKLQEKGRAVANGFRPCMYPVSSFSM
jgi:cation transport ATPase